MLFDVTTHRVRLNQNDSRNTLPASGIATNRRGLLKLATAVTGAQPLLYTQNSLCSLVCHMLSKPALVQNVGE